MKRRAAVERWRANNRDYYLQQKRELSARPEYRAHMRARYHTKRAELIAAGIAPRKLGRPRLYDGEKALEHKRQRTREASARYRTRQLLSQVEETYESEEIDSTTSENSP